MPSANFEAAAAYLSNAPSLAKVSTAVKLELYGLFKCATVGATPTTSRPSLFDMTGRAKWDAWAEWGKKYPTTGVAEARYIERAKELGWDGAAPQPTQKSEKAKGKEARKDEDNIWDDSDDEASAKKGGGLGVNVSRMAAPEGEVEENLHGYAVANDAGRIAAYLDAHPGKGVDAKDEYGFTPLHLATDRGNVEAVKMLLARGADAQCKDPDGLTAVELAEEAGHGNIRALFTST
ncbi:ankyrin [Schizophyllum commune H4-8]|uniref:ACB domain-containing protein n=1 Tax=Schizophyllum commune (strain H4-8 / FGSC 9210) TaxID=578458 RepID=D8PP76_SCHCM|nr:ankyrin [Schizophyllum commune H4-8]KAI5898445.1 ankyrin [Schizophyllum commune H4-8]